MSYDVTFERVSGIVPSMPEIKIVTRSDGAYCVVIELDGGYFDIEDAKCVAKYYRECLRDES